MCGKGEGGYTNKANLITTQISDLNLNGHLYIIPSCDKNVTIFTQKT